MAESPRKVISGNKLGEIFMPSSPMTTRSKRAAGAPSDPESDVDFAGEQQPILSNIDDPQTWMVTRISLNRV